MTMPTEPKGHPHPEPDTGPKPTSCACCESTREAGGSTCGDCGAFLALVPPAAAADRAAHLLEQLVAGAGAPCLYCPDPILAGDMFVGWALLGIVAHFGCYAQAQNLARPVTVEARS